MLHIAEAKQVGRGGLPYDAKLPWKDFSQELGGLGYRQVSEVPIPRVGSLHVLSRQNYSPPSFLPRNEPVHVSSAAMVHVYSREDKVGHILMTRPGIELSVEELARDADIMGRFFISRSRVFETGSSPNVWVGLGILGIYAAVGVGIGGLINQQVQAVENEMRYVIDGVLGIGFPSARILLENHVRQPLLQMRAASQMKVSSYLFGREAVKSVDSEGRAQQFETAASLVHAELKNSGVVVDEETFYRAFAIIRNLGVDKVEKIAPVAKVPLERIVEVVKAHPGLLPVPASAR